MQKPSYVTTRRPTGSGRRLVLVAVSSILAFGIAERVSAQSCPDHAAESSAATDWIKLKVLPNPTPDPSLQLSESELRSMSTASLLDACLGFPHVGLVLGVTADLNLLSSHVLVQELEERFNGFGAVLSRADAAMVLMNRYRDLKIDDRMHTDERFVDMHPIDRIMIVAGLLGEDRILARLSPSELQGLLCLVLKKDWHAPTEESLIRSWIDRAQTSRRQLAYKVLARLPASTAPAGSRPIPGIREGHGLHVVVHRGQSLDEAEKTLQAAGSCRQRTL